MGAPVSAVEICNIALDKLGQEPIASIENPTTVSETIMARHYDLVRRALLRSYVWNFAKKRVNLAPTTPGGLYDYETRFLLPDDCLRVLSIGGDGERRRDTEYDIEGRSILVNGAEANILRLRYIADVIEVSQWDALFTNLFPLMLAEAVAYKYTLKKGVLEAINGLVKQEIPKAVTIDGQERPPIKIQHSKYLQARTGGYGFDSSGIYTIAP